MRQYGLLLLISMIWGSQFALNKVLLVHMPPLWLAFFRIILGCLTLSAIVWRHPSKRLQLNRKDWGIFLLIGCLESALPLNLIAWGQTQVTSGTASILICTVPIWVVLINYFLQPERSSWRQLIAALVGFLGIVVLVAGAEEQVSIPHALALLSAAVSFATAIILIDRTLQRMPALIATRNILIGASIAVAFIVPFAPAFTWEPFWERPSLFLILGILGSVCTGLVWLAYTKLIQLAGASFTSMANYVMPAVGLLVGVLLLDEPLTVRKCLALLIIVAALLINRSPNNTTH